MLGTERPDSQPAGRHDRRDRTEQRRNKKPKRTVQERREDPKCWNGRATTLSAKVKILDARTRGREAVRRSEAIEAKRHRRTGPQETSEQVERESIEVDRNSRNARTP